MPTPRFPPSPPQLGRTETQKDTHTPRFAKSIDVRYFFETVQTVTFEVYDEDKRKSEFIGSVSVTLGEIVGVHRGVFTAVGRSRSAAQLMAGVWRGRSAVLSVCDAWLCDLDLFFLAPAFDVYPSGPSSTHSSSFSFSRLIGPSTASRSLVAFCLEHCHLPHPTHTSASRGLGPRPLHPRFTPLLYTSCAAETRPPDQKGPWRHYNHRRGVDRQQWYVCCRDEALP